MKKVSVVVPCYNQAKYLPDTLDSVLAQTYNNWECIIVNDGSSDDVEYVAIEYCKRDVRFKYVYQKNQGVSMARNNGIKESSGYYILPLDGDDKIESTYLEKAVKCFEDNPRTTLVYCKADFFGTENGLWLLPEYEYESFIWQNSIFVSALFKKDDFEKTEGYNINMDQGLEDWDFWLSLLDENSVVYRIDEVLFHYRIKEKSRNVDALKCSSKLMKQIVSNHKHIYMRYMDEILNLHNENVFYKNTINYDRWRIDQLESSHAYRLGCFLLQPVYWIKMLLKRTK